MPLSVDWFYSEQGDRMGPVGDSELESLFRSGRITNTTLVWRSGMAGWEPLQNVRRFVKVDPSAIGSGPAPTGTRDCVECHRQFPEAEMIFVNRCWVCAECKPLFVQRLKEGAAPPDGNVWRDGREVVFAKGTQMPDRCVKCNSPAHGSRLTRRFYWHPSAYFLLLLVMPCVYVALVFFITKRATIAVGICERHRRQRFKAIVGGWAAFLVGMSVFPIAFSLNSGDGIMYGMALAFVGGLYGAMMGRLVVPSRIDDHSVRVQGAGPEFLESLPDWPNAG